jgi:hypothetical protein
MPLYKFKTIEEADMTRKIYEPNDEYFESLKELFDFAFTINPPKIQKGVFKFKTMEDANRHRQESELKAALEK